MMTGGGGVYSKGLYSRFSCDELMLLTAVARGGTRTRTGFKVARENV